MGIVVWMRSEIRASFTQLLHVCMAFAATAGPGADIRDYGLTQDLLARCTRAVVAWRVQRARPPDSGCGASDTAAWHAYLRMRAAHGEDYS